MNAISEEMYRRDAIEAIKSVNAIVVFIGNLTTAARAVLDSVEIDAAGDPGYCRVPADAIKDLSAALTMEGK